MSRRSRRLASKAETRDKGDRREVKEKGRATDRRASIGDALGVTTPARSKATNLRQAKAMSSALAAAAKLNENNVSEKIHTGERGKGTRRRGGRSSAISCRRMENFA